MESIARGKRIKNNKKGKGNTGFYDIAKKITK
jgi:hypothetical protein